MIRRWLARCARISTVSFSPTGFNPHLRLHRMGAASTSNEMAKVYAYMDDGACHERGRERDVTLLNYKSWKDVMAYRRCSTDIARCRAGPNDSCRRSSGLPLRACYISLLVLIVWISLFSSAEDLRTLRHQAWSTEEGLPQSSVHSILQSRDGYIWLATEGGVARFDGVAFRTFAHASDPAFASDDVCCLAEGRAGAVWAGTADGLVRLQDGKLRRFGIGDGLPSTSILGLVTLKDGNLLVLTPEGLALGSVDGFRPLLPPLSHVLAIEASRDGGAWLIAESGVFVYGQGSVHAVVFPLIHGFGSVIGIAEGVDGTVWVRSANGVAVISSKGQREWKLGRALLGLRVDSLSVDRRGSAWVGTNSGLFLLTAASPLVTRLTALDGTAVLNSFEDAEGNHWVGTDASGLHVLRRLKFRSLPVLAGQALTAVVQTSDGAIWVGTRENGLRRVRNDAVDEPVPLSKLTSPVILSLAPGANGSLWVGTPDGLNHIDPILAVRRITSAEGLPDDFVRSLLTDNDGTLWIGTRRGLAHLQGTRVDTLTRAEGLGGDLVGSLLRTTAKSTAWSAPSALWIGTSGGLSCLHPDGSIRIYTTRDGLPRLIVTAMAQDDEGILWVATKDGGLSRLAGDHFQAVGGPGLSSEIIGITEDSKGFFWLRAVREVERVSREDLKRCTIDPSACGFAVARYGIADGLPSEEIVAGASPAMWQTSAGEEWFSTRRGIAVADAEQLDINLTPPPVVVQRFLIDETDTSFTAEMPQIPYGHERFTIEYAGLSYRIPSKVRYRYLLEGFDHAWTEAGSRRSATYTNLPARSYRFRVQASNDDGIWSPVGAELRFRIIPPFYRRWWFFVLLLLAAATIFSAGYQLHLRRLRFQFNAVLQERNRMAREIHDTLAQDFVGVSIQLDIVRQLLGQAKVEAAVEQVDQTRKLVVEGLAEARRTIWALRANTAADSLPTRLAHLLKRYATEGLDLRLNISGVFRPLATGLESEVLRIAQEALSNINRHAEASEGTVDLRYSSDMLVLEIHDNGRGFVVDRVSAPDSRYGIKGMRERASILRSQLDIESAPGQGTKVRLSVAIPPADRQAHAPTH
jgi:signal transduction histidine kinase/ligand-binding sensor domain-containing protein